MCPVECGWVGGVWGVGEDLGEALPSGSAGPYRYRPELPPDGAGSCIGHRVVLVVGRWLGLVWLPGRGACTDVRSSRHKLRAKVR